MIYENHPWRPWFREILVRHQAGFFGKLRCLRVEQHDASAHSEKSKVDAAHGVLLEYGVHLVAMIRALIGEPLHVAAKLERINPRVRGESLAHLVFGYAEATAIIDVAWKAQGVPQGRVVLVGDEGKAIYEGSMTRDGESRFRLLCGDEVIFDEHRNPLADYIEAFYLLEREFTDCMLTGRACSRNADYHLRTNDVIGSVESRRKIQHAQGLKSEIGHALFQAMACLR